MNIKLTIVLIMTFSSLFGQHFQYPTIRDKGKMPMDFVPEGWTVLDSASGLLNNDKTIDVALILQHTDSVLLCESLEDSSDFHMTQPRIIIILVKNSFDNLFHLMGQNNHIILTHDVPYEDDPYQSIMIKNKVLQINLQWYPNSGNQYRRSDYKFRFQKDGFFLIGEDHEDDNKATHDFTRNSLNYLTLKQSQTFGNWDKPNSHSKTYPLNINKLTRFNDTIPE